MATQSASPFTTSYQASAGYESLDYDEAENDIARARLRVPERERKRQRTKQAVVMWVLVVTIGFLGVCGRR